MNKALKFFEDETELFEELYDSYPQNVSFKNGLAVSYWKIGDFYRTQKDKNNVIFYFKKCEILLIQLSKAAPNHKAFQDNLEENTNDLKNL